MSYPLGSCTWVPANSYNYIDIYANKSKRNHDPPARVLEHPKLIKQKKLLIDAKKRKLVKKRSNHYDELCLQYQYAQDWLNKRNSRVSVKLTKAELKVFLKWFDSRMNRFQKDDGIDVEKVSEDFVSHKIFQSQSDALAFLAKIDLDGNGALSYEEFCEGLQTVNDYLQVMLLKKFVHSLQQNAGKNLKLGHLAERKLKKDENEEKKVIAGKTSLAAKAIADAAVSAIVTKISLPGGGVMYTHSPNKKRMDVSSPIAPLTKKSSQDKMPVVDTNKNINDKAITRRGSVFGSTLKNSVQVTSNFIKTGAQDDDQQDETKDSSKPVLQTKSSAQDLERIQQAMEKNLEAFQLVRQMSVEERENLREAESLVNDGESFELSESSRTNGDLDKSSHDSESFLIKPKVAWEDAPKMDSPKTSRLKKRLYAAMTKYKV